MYIRSKLPHTYLLFKNSNVFRGECVSLTGVLSPRPDALDSSAAWRRVVLGTKRFFRTGAPFRILPYTSSVCSDAHHPSRREAKIHHFLLLLLCHLPLWYTDLLLDGATRSWVRLAARLQLTFGFLSGALQLFLLNINSTSYGLKLGNRCYPDVTQENAVYTFSVSVQDCLHVTTTCSGDAYPGTSGCHMQTFRTGLPMGVGFFLLFVCFPPSFLFVPLM